MYRLTIALVLCASIFVLTAACTSGQASGPSGEISGTSAPDHADAANTGSETNDTTSQAPTAHVMPTTTSVVPAPLATTNTPSPCPVTTPNGNMPPGERPSPHYHGNDALWTVLWPGGKIFIPPDGVLPDGSMEMKFPWWRGPGVRGELTIWGRRLDAAAPPLRAHIPAGYDDTGVQASGIMFPSEGCWEVTGREGGASMTIVTLVVRIGAQP